MPQTPDYKGPSGSVPETGSEEDDKEIKVSPNISFSISAQGNIEIVSEPSRKRYVPSSPEFRYGLRDIGVIEVLRRIKAEHLAYTYRHIGITGKIKE